MENKKTSNNFLYKLSELIVDKRNLVFLVVIIGLIFSVFSSSWVEVENDLSAFLPDGSPSKEGLDVMDEQFVTYGTAEVMISTISISEAWDVKEKIETISGVQSVAFDETTSHYNNASSLYQDKHTPCSHTPNFTQTFPQLSQTVTDIKKGRAFYTLPVRYYVVNIP